MDRTSFLQSLTGTRKTTLNPMSGLNPYSGPWTKTQALHLLRRALFGVKKSDLDQALSLGMNHMVDTLLDANNDPQPSPPLNNYSLSQEANDVAPGKSWVNEPVFNNDLTLKQIPLENYQARKDSFKLWWTGNIINQKTTLVEKMTLFWYNHFSIELDQIFVAQPVYHYYRKLRIRSLGDFKAMLKDVTLDPAMLFYLNGQNNSKTAPDENYAREVQELFTVGKGPESKYTENDVKEAARVLTGFRINPFTVPMTFYIDIFNPTHDTGTKQFSAFYNNKKINANLSPEVEVDEFLKMLTDNKETARFLCRKLYQFFVYYEISNDAEMNVIRPLADFMYANNYNIKLTLEKLFKSEHFYDAANLGCVIKNPLDYSVGLFKEFTISLPGPGLNPVDVRNQYLGWTGIAYLSAYQGLNLADPPVVSGYQAWYQAPQYHEIWINSDTLASRNNVANTIFSENGLDVNGVIYKIDPFIFTKTLSSPQDANALVKEATERLYNHTLSKEAIDYLKSFLIGGLPDETYWTDIWENYIANPTNPSRKMAAETRLKALYNQIVIQAEFHLS
ncbi:MAG: DUF1800 domain-containing protein [Saprospiraceae bacterium]|nr:DUF1800 domain-containing protein [Saprospiraceae bacterium]